MVKVNDFEVDADRIELVKVPDLFCGARYVAHEFTSKCPVTGQPDMGEISIFISNYPRPKGLPESKSLKLYLFGYRQYGCFHEQIISQVAEDVGKKCGASVFVDGNFAPRGGISIHPTAHYEPPMPKVVK
jgi:7-cyano-7-deazaguanine reductase